MFFLFSLMSPLMSFVPMDLLPIFSRLLWHSAIRASDCRASHFRHNRHNRNQPIAFETHINTLAVIERLYMLRILVFLCKLSTLFVLFFSEALKLDYGRVLLSGTSYSMPQFAVLVYIYQKRLRWLMSCELNTALNVHFGMMWEKDCERKNVLYKWLQYATTRAYHCICFDKIGSGEKFALSINRRFDYLDSMDHWTVITNK